MEVIEINQALSKMRELIEMASSGAEIVITQDNQPLVKLMSVSNQKFSIANVNKIA